jgi:hypothetical protein
VRPFPDVGAGKWPVSSGGGVAPVWAHNGRDLFFGDPSTRTIRAVTFSTDGANFRPGPVRTVVELPPDILFGASGNVDFYDVDSGDDRFLMARTVGGQGAPALILVQNFLSELRRSGQR